MQPASKRSTRSRVTLGLGPMSVTVNVFSGTAKPESPKSYCSGPDGSPHDLSEMESLGRRCPHCTDGRVVQAYKADDGSLVPIPAAAKAERLENVERLRDRMDLVSVAASDLAASAIDSGNVYWLVPSATGEDVNYAGLVQAIENDSLVLITAWASRTVAKPYRIGVVDGLLTMTELVPASSLRMSPSEPPRPEREKVNKAAKMFALAAAMEETDRDGIAALAVDPGREALRRAANRSREDGAEGLKVKRGERVVFEQRLAEAALTASLETS